MWSSQNLPRHYYGRYDVIGQYEYLASWRIYLVLFQALYVLFNYKVGPRIRKLEENSKLLTFSSMVWNGFNATLNFYVFVMVWPEAYEAMNNGWYYTVCKAGNMYANKFSGHGVYVFTIATALSLGDTVVMVLRGRRPSLIHVAYHAIVPFQAILPYFLVGSMARILILMHTFVNFFMYTYFFATDVYDDLVWSARFVTSLQLMECIIACGTMTSLAAYIADGRSCDTNYYMLPLHFAVYVGFMALYTKFFAVKYLGARRRQEKLDKAKRV